jgi:hypothetical protein
VDGSTLRLPHSEDTVAQFPDIYQGINCTHYPKARILMATHVLSGIPKCLRIDSQFIGEREIFKTMLPDIEDDSILLLDRGFDGISSLNEILKQKKSFICRIRSDVSSSKQVYSFVKGKKAEAVVTLVNKHGDEITLRLLRYRRDRQGNAIVLATNLFDREAATADEVWDLYSRRWDIETSYFRVKNTLNVEAFHSKKINGILQELWANLIVLGMSSYLILMSWGQRMKKILREKSAPNFKNANMVLLRYFVPLIFEKSEIKKRNLMSQIGAEVLSVRCIKQFGRKNPRISKRPLTTWSGGRKNRPKNRIARCKFRRGIYA